MPTLLANGKVASQFRDDGGSIVSLFCNIRRRGHPSGSGCGVVQALPRIGETKAARPD
jgi:hypothetical protein